MMVVTAVATLTAPLLIFLSIIFLAKMCQKSLSKKKCKLISQKQNEKWTKKKKRKKSKKKSEYGL